MSETRRSPIGRTAEIRHDGEVLTATVIDEVPGTRQAKRMRVQTPGRTQGNVLMPYEYELLEYVT